MKKGMALLLVLTSLFLLMGCQSRSLNSIIKNEPSIIGEVREVHEGYILIYFEDEGYPNGAECVVSLDVEYKDSVTELSVGDVVTVYHDGMIMESAPLQLHHVYAILLTEPADRSENNVS